MYCCDFLQTAAFQLRPGLIICFLTVPRATGCGAGQPRTQINLQLSKENYNMAQEKKIKSSAEREMSLPRAASISPVSPCDWRSYQFSGNKSSLRTISVWRWRPWQPVSLISWYCAANRQRWSHFGPRVKEMLCGLFSCRCDIAADVFFLFAFLSFSPIH